MADEEKSDTTRNAQIGALLMRHRTSLFGYIFSCVPNHADAEDILQTVSLTASMKFEKLTDEAGFLPYTLEIARRQILAHHRKSRRTAVMPPEVIAALTEAALEGARQGRSQSRAEALMECLEQLPERGAELILARYGEAFRDVEQLAATIGRTASATYALLKRTRIALRDCVDRKLGSASEQ